MSPPPRAWRFAGHYHKQVLLRDALCTSDSDFAFAVAHVPIPRVFT